MAWRMDWTGMSAYLAIGVVAVGLTAWQVRIDRSVFEPYFGSLPPVPVVVAAVAAGAVALAHLQAISDLAVVGPGGWRDAAVVLAWAVPLLALVAVAADVVLRFPEDTNVALPGALRFYPAIAVFVEVALHLVPVAVLVSLLGAPTGFDASFWRIALPVAAIEAVLQAVYATSVGTAAFSGMHLLVFGVVQVWVFWRFGFVWMLGFRLAYYALWHLAWGAARLELLF